MAMKFPDGSVVGFATVMSQSVAFSISANGNPTKITHSGELMDKDVIAITQSSWTGLNNRTSQVETDGSATQLLGINTSDTELFRGSATGQLVVASSFVDFSQQGELTSSGGEPQTYTGKYLEDPQGQEFAVPYGQTARQYGLTLDYDASLPWFEPAKAVTRKRKPTIIRIQLPGGDAIYEYGYVHFNPGLTMQSGQPIKNAVTFFLLGSEGTLVVAGDE